MFRNVSDRLPRVTASLRDAQVTSPRSVVAPVAVDLLHIGFECVTKVVVGAAGWQALGGRPL